MQTRNAVDLTTDILNNLNDVDAALAQLQTKTRNHRQQVQIQIAINQVCEARGRIREFQMRQNGVQR